jgi:hypothetical protein
MKRIAILIGSPGIPYLNGVPKDIENIKQYLKSSNGGGWTTTEIKETILNPSAKDTLFLLDNITNADFAFVYYSGHGFTGSDNRGKININSNEVLNISDLANRCKKQITIIDACRGYEAMLGFDRLSEQVTFSFDTSNIEDSKAVFNDYLNYSKDGKVLLFASQKGENAQDTSSGGIFSTNILKSAKYLIDKSTNPIVNVHSVFNQAKELTKNYHTPHIEFTIKDALNFPFGIKPKRLEKSAIKKSSEDNGNALAGVLAVVGIALLIGAIFSDNKKK